jgi:predicted nucleotidyltransferase
MRRDEVVATLRAHEAELRHAGVSAWSLFGSVARDAARETSDVDVLVRLYDAAGSPISVSLRRRAAA